jgi:ribonuclease PH
MRIDGRKNNELREVKIISEVARYAEGSVKIEMGNTHVYCTASVEDGIPKWLMGTGKGWVTAEYGMLPRSTHTRINREKASTSGRTHEISRLIGRSLRSAVDLSKIGERQIYVDCDVIQADGGTRTAAITGGFVALCLAFKYLLDQGIIKEWPIKYYLAAVSVGLKNNSAILDLNYDEDSTIHTDMNYVMNQNGEFIEVQGTAEGSPFNFEQLIEMTNLAKNGCNQLFSLQNEVVGNFFPLSR